MKQLRYTSVIVLLMLFMEISHSQTIDEAIGFEDNVDDVPAAPVNRFISVGLIAGVVVGVTYLKPRLR
ncbi:hypothetical protein SAMN05444278_106155 [Psychroflexus salarius]|uniref:Uncharacterized protein n=1 Tax=Psychroflexus salarius TaxID=1155689 RepID=A0A1M4WTW2_9FLAO|nr:hypothetical protein [Psychroflexus salarius]SHE84412.1 hypothetical protein SAMN05444278_106155 [Psychroflexus salarius]